MFKKNAATAGIAGLIGFALLSSPALAASLKISQKAESGGTNPASHITVVDDSGNTVKEIDYAGGSAEIDPVDVEVGKSYTVDATADGYDFRAQSGTITQDATFPVTLTAVKAANLIIQFQADGVSDYSGISASLYQGADTSGQAKATATTDSSGKITFNNVPHGDYTMRIVLPPSLASAGFASDHVIKVPEEGDETITVTVKPENAGQAQETQQPAEQPKAEEQKAEEPKKEEQPAPAREEVKATNSSNDPISKTGDALMDNLIGLSAAAIAFSIVAPAIRKLRRK